MSSETASHDGNGRSTGVPYPVPFSRGVSEGAARAYHREWYWDVHDQETYECPDCERGFEDVWRFDVHHIAGNPRNGAPENLLALCQRCHQWRHASGPSMSSLSVDEWKREFENITESSFGGEGR